MGLSRARLRGSKFARVSAGTSALIVREQRAMDYNRFKEKLQDLLANRLPEVEAAVLRQHISGCRACSMILEDVKISYAVPAAGEEALAGCDVEIDGYKIVAQLGKGGMGTVFRAVQLSLNRNVALKILSEELVKDDALIARFEREARAAARLSHPNLVDVYDCGRAGEVYFFSMEYIDGKTVYRLIKEKGQMPTRRTLEIALKVAEALEYASEMGIIHRDIKPENIMIDSTGVVKLTDMGLAKEVGGDADGEGSITMVGERLGTPDYMSPEQIKETRNVDHRADIYSLGATMFHMLTGRRPFAGKTAVEIMEQVLEKEVEFTPEEESLVPSGVRSLVLEMLEKNYRHRIQSWKLVIRRTNALLTRPPRAPRASAKKRR